MRRGWVWLYSVLLISPCYAGPPRSQVAEAWAPIVYQDVSSEFSQVETGFNPVDHLVDLFFDDMDIQNNGVEVFRVADKKAEALLETTTIYYSVIETESHWYLNYILYHAIDMNIWSHTHDTENIWMIVEKDEKPFGSLIALVANAHGHPNIYADEARQASWRSKVESVFGRWGISVIDRHSRSHHSGALEKIERSFGSAHPLIFAATKTHALYKFSTSAWREKEGEGVVYVPKTCKEECGGVGWIAENPARQISYELVNWDGIHARFLSADGSIFTDQKRQFVKIKRAGFFPRFLLPAPGESEARALLFHATHFKTPYRLGDPALVHRFFEGSSLGISDKYLYNPYSPEKRKANPWSLMADSEWPSEESKTH